MEGEIKRGRDRGREGRDGGRDRGREGEIKGDRGREVEIMGDREI